MQRNFLRILRTLSVMLSQLLVFSVLLALFLSGLTCSTMLLGWVLNSLFNEASIAPIMAVALPVICLILLGIGLIGWFRETWRDIR